MYVDSDILIWHLRGEKQALKFLKKLRSESSGKLYIGAMQRAEVVFFMRAGEEECTMLFLSQFQTMPVDQSIVDNAGAIYRRWNPSHGTDANDALLAATVIHSGGVLYTLNKKHYPMENLVVYKAW